MTRGSRRAKDDNGGEADKGGSERRCGAETEPAVEAVVSAPWPIVVEEDVTLTSQLELSNRGVAAAVALQELRIELDRQHVTDTKARACVDNAVAALASGLERLREVLAW